MADPLIEAIVNRDYDGVTSALTSPQDTTEYNIKTPEDVSQNTPERSVSDELQRLAADRDTSIKQIDESIRTLDSIVPQLDKMFTPEEPKTAVMRRLMKVFGPPNEHLIQNKMKLVALDQIMQRRNELLEQRRLTMQLSKPEEDAMKSRIEAWGKNSDEESRGSLASVIGLQPGSLEYWRWRLEGKLPESSGTPVERLKKAGDLGGVAPGITDDELAAAGVPKEEWPAYRKGAEFAAKKEGRKADSADGGGEGAKRIGGVPVSQILSFADKNYKELRDQVRPPTTRYEYDKLGNRVASVETPQALSSDEEFQIRTEASRRLGPEAQQYLRDIGWVAGQQPTPTGETPLDRLRRLSGSGQPSKKSGEAQ